MLNRLGDILRIVDGVVHLAHTPSIPPFDASEIDGIAFLPLTYEHTITEVDSVDALELLNV